MKVKIIDLIIFLKNIFLASFLNPVYEGTIKFLKNLPYILPDFLQDNLKIARSIAEKLVNFSSLFCLGKGFGEAIAR